MSLSDWMAEFPRKKLSDLQMPGSHDAGITKHYLDKTLFGTDSNSATQNLSFRDQLRAGTRFFDLRLESHNHKVVAQHTTAGQGAYSSRGIDSELAKIGRWCLRHPTEVVIIRISHTSLGTDVHRIARKQAGEALHRGQGNLCRKSLRRICRKGNLVLIFDEGKFGSVINQKKGIHSYSKYKKNPANDRGISTCGCYSGTNALHKVVRNGLRGQYEHNSHVSKPGHLCQVYWQKTYTNPFHGTGIEQGTHKKARYSHGDGRVHGGTHAATDYMLRLMQGLSSAPRKNPRVRLPEDYVVQEKKSHKEGWRRKTVVDQEKVMYSTEAFREFALPNIISYDFVNEEVNRKIIQLNRRGLQAT